MRDRLSGFWGFLTANFKWLLLLFFIYLGAVQAGVVEPVVLPETPEWYRLVVIGGIAAALVCWIAAGRIMKLLPESPRRYIVELREEEEDNRLWRLTPDAFEALTVRNGRLYQWEGTKHPVYECVSFDPEKLEAVGTWRENVPASEIVGKTDVKDAMSLAMSIRGEFEREAQMGEAVRRHIDAIIRRKDAIRAKQQNRALEGHLTPSIGDELTTDEIIVDVLGPDLAPDWMVDQDDADQEEEIEGGAFELIDADTEAFVDVEPDGGQEVGNGR